MAEPLSFVASIVAVSTLAENVVTKGYKYLKAAKDCRNDVASLMAEVNVLCGILNRLTVLIQNNKTSTSRWAVTSGGAATFREDEDHDYDYDYDENTDSEDSQDYDVEAETTNLQLLHPPVFIYECQKTLFEIEQILNGFYRASNESSKSTKKVSRFSLSKLSRLEAKDLKWPLSKSKTLELIGRLERHKSTCTIALAKDGVAGVHGVLEQTKLSNRYLADIKARQERILEMSISQEEEKALAWLSLVDPRLKLQAYRRERQPGSGTWLFDLPQTLTWLEKPNAALWIYGIPGAGKTLLSTLVVDDILNRKRSMSTGTAYFYIRHDDHQSHKLSNVIGSLISQLARQHPLVLAEVMDMYAEYAATGSRVTPMEDDKLIELLHNASNSFSETYFMIDGIDECGSPFDQDRKRLIDAVADLNSASDSNIRIMVFSRDESDIRKRFEAMESISVAATSADLRLFINGWLPSLEVRSEELKVEITDTLVDKANGMFMWVRAQIDVLRRLPNDLEKKKALSRLPPDLPQTYIQILESIDSSYPDQTKIYIMRILKLLVLAFEPKRVPNRYSTGVLMKLTSDALCEVICIEDEHSWPPDGSIPRTDQVHSWLGCLIRNDKVENVIHLSHYTIKEFLLLDSENIQSSVARKYLLNSEDQEYPISLCLKYLTNDHFADTQWSTYADIDAFDSRYPFYSYATVAFCDHLCDHLSSLEESDDFYGRNKQIQKFFAAPPCRFFELWNIFSRWLDLKDRDEYHSLGSFRSESVEQTLPSSLHLAAFLGLHSQVQTLLDEKMDPDFQDTSIQDSLTALHLAIYHGMPDAPGIWDEFVSLEVNCFADHEHWDQEESLKVVKLLVQAGADVNQPVGITFRDNSDECESGDAIVTPLTLAVFFKNYKVAQFLLNVGALCFAGAEIDMESASRTYVHDCCSIQGLLDAYPQRESIVERLIDLTGHTDLIEALKDWKHFKDTDGHCSYTESDSTSSIDHRIEFIS